MAERDDYDVAVIGAGFAGVAAASTAAGEQARVVLIESSNRLGGAVTAAMHRSLCGLYADAPRSPIDTLNDGFQRDLVTRMMRKDAAAVVPRRFGKAWVLEFPSAACEQSLSDACTEGGIDLRTETRVTAVRREGDRLTAIQTEDPAARWIDVRAVIDCTGAGNVIRLIGSDVFQLADETDGRILGGFSVRLTGLTGDPEMQRLQVIYVLGQGVKEGRLSNLARFTSFYPGPGIGQGVCKLAIDSRDCAAAEAEAVAKKIVAYLKQEQAGFAAAEIVEMSPRVVPRDGLRLNGKYRVTEQDILQARKHDADAVHAWWPMEKWDVADGPTYAYPPVGDYYDIPGDALRSAVLENVFAAGTCLSASAAAAASVRASGICLATGAAAGKLAISCLNQ